MRVLGIDTTGPHCSAAIVNAAGIIALSSDHIKRGHAEHLAPQVKTLFAKANLKPADIDRIIVCVGPGSFTGLRVGIALGKGLALPRKIPVVGISALQVWAAMADPSQSQTVMSIADVRRGEVFWQIFDKGAATGTPELSHLSDALSEFKPGMIATGNGAHLLSDAPAAVKVSPAILAWLGMNMDPAQAPANPLYHRPPDAKLPGGIDPTNAR